MTTSKDQIISIIADLATVPAEDIQPSDHLREDLGMDSITSMELISALAEELDLEIDVEEAIGVTTVGEVISMVEARIHGAEPRVAAER